MRFGRLAFLLALTHRWWLLSALRVTQQPPATALMLLTPPAAPSAGLPGASEAGSFQKRMRPWSATISWLSATATPPAEVRPAPVLALPAPLPKSRRVGTVGEAPGANISTSFW